MTVITLSDVDRFTILTAINEALTTVGTVRSDTGHPVRVLLSEARAILLRDFSDERVTP